MPKFQFFLFAFILSSLGVVAQSTDRHKIQELIAKRNYALAQSHLSTLEIDNLTSLQIEERQFNLAVCAMELFNEDANFQLEKYLQEYPKGIFVNDVQFNLGNLFFRDKNYTAAIVKYAQLNPDLLKDDERDMFYFRQGYSYFVAENFEEAKLSFQELNGVQFKFKDLTNYYVSHIAYLEGNYATALNGFEKLKEVPGIGSIVRYYIAQIYYLQGRNQELLAFALPLLDSANTKRSPEIARLIGDAYYRTNQFTKSIYFLERFQNATTQKIGRLDKYQLGFAYYQEQNIEQAIVLFQEVLQDDDSLAQYAAYHLADCYMQNNQKGYALNAYKYAASFNFDANLQEDAAFNHAKLVYEHEATYADAVGVFQNYITQFPKSEYLPLVQDYLVKSYSSSSNYKEALSALERLDQLTFEQKQVYQRMAFFRGVELFNQDDKDKAIQFFDQSLKYSYLPEYKALCYYWKGEAFHAMGNFSQAVNQFEKFLYSSGSFRLAEYTNVYYALGYSEYQQQNYTSAIKWFRKYINNTSQELAKLDGMSIIDLSDEKTAKMWATIQKEAAELKQKLNDSFLRAGDSYFMKKQYMRAVDFYAQAQKTAVFDIDYAIYQQALCYGLSSEIAKKKAVLLNLIDNHTTSPYVDDAKYALADIYLSNGLQEEGLFLMQDVVDNHPYSPLVKRALLKLGLYYYNTDNVLKASSNFKRVIEDYPGTSESVEALVGLKNVYIEAGDVRSYFDYVEGLSNVSVSALAQDSITYEAAEMLYAKGEHSRAVSAFSEYLQNFPQAVFKLSAHFYKAEALFTLGNNESLTEYIAVLEFKQNQFTERALSQAARLEMGKKDFGVAALHYTQLLEQAQDKELQREATVALLNCYMELQNADQMLAAAQAVMSLDKLDNDLQVKARSIIANHAYEQSEFYLAKKHYQWIVSATNSEAGAKAQYQLAYILFLQDDFSKTEEQIFQLAENFTDDYHIAKGFILLGDVYLAQGNLFQAKATLESVIENHEGDELKQLAIDKKQAIELLELQQDQTKEESEIIIDLLKDMEIDFDDLLEEEIIEEDED